MNSTLTTSTRPFVPGTTGWTAADLDDPEIEREWVRGAYEIVEGVLTTMSPAYFAGGAALFKLMFRVASFAGESSGEFATEVEVVIEQARVARSDAAYLTRADWARQTSATLAAGRLDPLRTRILVPPTLIIESVSPGHESHDLRTKRRWFAEFGVPNYWILDAFARSLHCLVLNGHEYSEDAVGTGDQEIRPALFPGLVLRLSELWGT